jgi:hypothetical protein
VSEHRYDFIQYFSLLVLFIVCPLALIYFKFNMAMVFGFVIGIAALLTDGFLTKLGLKLGCKELNPSFAMFNKKIGGDRMILL